MNCRPDTTTDRDLRRPSQPCDAAALRRALGRVIVVDPTAQAHTVEEQIEANLGRVVAVTSSVTEALLAASRPSEADAVVVAFAGVDRFAGDWAGPRLIGRLRTRTDTTVIAALSGHDVDGAAYAARAGAHLLLTASRFDQPGLSGAPEPREAPASEASPNFPAFETWFRGRYARAWQPWMIDAAAAIASGSDRGTQADWCQEFWQFESEVATQRRLRDFRASLCGEVREESGLERGRALDVLRRYGRHTPITREPAPVRSLSHAADALQHGGDVWARLLTAGEQADLIEVAAADDDLATRCPQEGPGRPPRGAWRARRSYAIGIVAARRASTLEAKTAIQRELTTGIQDTVMLIHDALDDGAAE